MDKCSIERELIEIVNEVKVEKRASRIKLLIFVSKIMTFLLSRFGYSVVLIVFGAVLYHFIFGTSLFSIGLLFIAVPTTMFILEKLGLVNFKDDYEEYKYTIKFLRDLRDDKVDTE